MKTLHDLKIAEVELIYKTKVKASERPKITNSAQSHEVLRAAFDLDKIEHVEMFYILLLNRNNKVLGVKKISEGGTCSTICDPKIIFQTALKANASGIILSHNHPSGNMTASNEDRSMTKRLCEGARLLDIQILDHIILSPENTYLSFSDEGLM
jgi:DNA repair protein RadC